MIINSLEIKYPPHFIEKVHQNLIKKKMEAKSGNSSTLFEESSWLDSDSEMGSDSFSIEEDKEPIKIPSKVQSQRKKPKRKKNQNPVSKYKRNHPRNDPKPYFSSRRLNIRKKLEMPFQGKIFILN